MMQAAPKVSVIMPAYNAEKYIAEAISSVVLQTFKDWELIVIDDCSSDRTAEVAGSYAAADPRIRIYRNERNIGVAETRNRGFAAARGRWAALLDSDDLWHDDKLEKQLAVAELTGADIIYCSYSLIDAGGNKISDFIVPAETSYSDMLRENVLSCSTVLLSKAIFSEYRFTTDYYHEDYTLWLKLLKAGYSAAACCGVLVDYRVTRNSRSGDKLRSAKHRWIIYRKAEKLSFSKSVRLFAGYARRGIAKHKRTKWKL